MRSRQERANPSCPGLDIQAFILFKKESLDQRIIAAGLTVGVRAD